MNRHSIVSIFAAVSIAATANAQTTPTVLPGHAASETPLSLSMWAGQTDPNTLRLAWDHIPEAGSYVVSCAYGNGRPSQIATVSAAGIEAFDDNGLPHRFFTTVPIRDRGIHRCYLQWRRGTRGVLSSFLPFNQVTPVGGGPRTDVSGNQRGPASVRARATASNEITVEWSAVPRATGYTISRSESPGGSSTVCDFCSTQTTFVDRHVTAGGRYTYAVSAVTASGTSQRAVSNTVVATGAPEQITNNGQRRYRRDSTSWAPSRVETEVNDSLFAIVRWRPVDRASGYEVFRAFRDGRYESVGYVNAQNAGRRVVFRDYLGGFVTSRSSVTARYAVRSVDDANVRSALTGGNEITIPAGTRKPGLPNTYPNGVIQGEPSANSPTDLKSTTTYERAVQLTWTPPQRPVSCVMMRSLNNGPFVTIATLQVGTSSYTDNTAGLRNMRPRYQLLCGNAQISPAVPFPNPAW